jgi:hypothetical protein
MRTAIYVYQPTVIHISISESDVHLCGMNTATVALSEGDNTRTVAPGIYKIVSSQEVRVTGDTSAFEVIANNKDNDPKPPPLRAVERFAPLDTSALHAFLAIPDAKVAVSP